jgi:hypothetical protein
MTDPVDLAARRFGSRGSGPDLYTAEEALVKMLADVRSGKVKPLHIVIAFAAERSDGGLGTEYLQAGGYNKHGQIGLVEVVASMMKKGDR